MLASGRLGAAELRSHHNLIHNRACKLIATVLSLLGACSAL